ncbi:MAG: hypothetical protein JNL58_24260 [Planctomyces sp.]|nr:hypothetical protein [Planctomyces sp.]
MKQTLLTLCCLCLALSGSFIPDTACAQLPQTRITSVFPAGAQAGTTAEITVTGGTDLDEVDQLIFSHPGITAIQKKDANGNPVASTFVVAVDATVPAGLYDARVRGLFGISNPRTFRVDNVPESAETEPNNEIAQATALPFGSVVNARSNGGADIDFFRIPVAAGQTIVVRSEAARLDSLMQPAVQLFNSSGRRLQESRRMFGQDAVMVYTSPVAEDLIVRVSDIVYGGGNEYVYRLCVDSRPQVDFVLPLVVSRDQPSDVTVFGRNLPGGQPTSMKIGNTPLQQKIVRVEPAALSSSAAGFPSYSASLETVWWNGSEGSLIPVCPAASAGQSEIEDGTEPTLALPLDLSGSFHGKDEDAVRFNAAKGETWVIDVFAHSIGSTADPLLMVEKVVKAADGTETFARLATEDDNKQNPGGNDLPTLNSDPSFTLAVPEDGTYRVRLRDRYADSRTDPRLVWRLTIRKPAPDFRIVVFDSFPSADGLQPSSSGAISLRKGGNYQLPVYVFRQDGHNESVWINAENLPEGVTCPGALIGPGQVSAVLVLSASESASELAVPVLVSGRSGGGESAVTRLAQVATLVHDPLNGMPRTARMSDSLVVGVMKDDQPFSISIEPIVADLSQDQQLLVPVKLIRRQGFDGKVDFTFLGLPANTDAPAFAIDKGQETAIARLFIKDNVAPTGSTIVISGTAPVPYRRNPWLSVRAQEKVAAAAAALATRQQGLTDADAALKASQQKVTQATEQIAALAKEIESYLVAQKPLAEKFTASLSEYKASTTDLASLRDRLAATQSSSASTPEQIDAAVKAVAEATAVVEAASVKLVALNEKTLELSKALADVRQQEAAKVAEKTTAEASMPELMKAVEAATAALAEAQKQSDLAQNEKKAADEAFAKAEEATKPNNVNVRTISAPIQITVHAAPAKLTAQVPDGGTIRKGATIQIKATIARKNGFAGPMQITLVTPPGVTGLSAEPVTIAADQTEGTLILAAAADAAVADIPNVVLRATGDVGGRAAAVDFPTQLKVTE